MSLKPYHNFQEAQEAGRFNPTSDEILNASCAYSAAISYLSNYGGGETAVKIFENVVRDYYKNKAITEKDLIDIAKKMEERGFLVSEDIRKKWATHLAQIANARIGRGDPLQGYLMGFA